MRKAEALGGVPVVCQPEVGTEGAIPLCDLHVGQRAEVVWVNKNNPFAGRYRDLGFVPGSVLYVRHRAPLSGPVEYEIRGSRFCLRNQDTNDIYVRLLEG